MSNFTVVIPLYNHEKYIESTIQSVFDQTHQPSEIILIDDGSSDMGFEKASNMLHSFDGAKLIKQQNCGAHVAINKAISLATGDYIAILNSDDHFARNKLERVNDILTENSSIDLIFGGVQFFNQYGDLINSGTLIEWMQRALSFYHQNISLQISLINENFSTTTSNFVFKKNLWESNGGFKNLRYCNDYEFLLSAFKFGSVYFDSSNVHILYRIHDRNTISEDVRLVRQEVASVIAATLVERDFYREKFSFNNHSIQSLKIALESKNVLSILPFLMGLYGQMSSTQEYYDFLAHDQNKSYFSNYL
jgi:glycosyltransferase involved in cell wall biosynthesis